MSYFCAQKSLGGNTDPPSACQPVAFAGVSNPLHQATNYKLPHSLITTQAFPFIHTCCICTAGLVSRLGAPGMPSLTEAALQTLSHRPELPQALLQQAYALDQQAVKLLTQRQQGILAGFAGLQAYSAALRLVLPGSYADTTHHGQWAQAIGLAVDASNSQVEAILDCCRAAACLIAEGLLHASPC